MAQPHPVVQRGLPATRGIVGGRTVLVFIAPINACFAPTVLGRVLAMATAGLTMGMVLVWAGLLLAGCALAVAKMGRDIQQGRRERVRAGSPLPNCQSLSERGEEMALVLSDRVLTCANENGASPTDVTP